MSLATQVHSHGRTRAQSDVKSYHIGVGVTGVLKGMPVVCVGAFDPLQMSASLPIDSDTDSHKGAPPNHLVTQSPNHLVTQPPTKSLATGTDALFDPGCFDNRVLKFDPLKVTSACL